MNKNPDQGSNSILSNLLSTGFYIKRYEDLPAGRFIE